MRRRKAYCCYACLQKLQVREMREGMLGGWAQTSSALSPLGFLFQKEASRMMHSQCLNCGSKDHFANACSKPLAGALYPCQCGKVVSVTARGQTIQQTATKLSQPSSSSNALPAAAALQAQPQVRKRTAERMAADVVGPAGGGALLPFDSS